jgi:DNA-binding NtrC family response regulator
MSNEPTRVLLVDDETGFTEVMSKRLARRDMIVCTADGGAEAIRKLRDEDFHVALLDLKMEDMSGIEVLQIFKKMVPEMPVIMLTGHGSEEAAREGMQQGAFDYLLKPCDFEQLLAKIRAATAQK